MVSNIQTPLRSVLFVPAANLRALEKLAQLKVDAVIVDLEDSVGVAERETAVANIQTIAAQGVLALRPTLLRIGGGPEGVEVGRQLLPLGFAGVVVPKVEAATDLTGVAKACRMPLWAMIETPRGVVNLKEICATEAGLMGLIAGPNDLRHGLRSVASADRGDIAQALALIVLHGRAGDLRVIDGVYNNFRDEAGLRAECAQGRALGFDGKTLIHPAQIDIAHQAFGASEAELSWARAVVAAFGRPENADKGVVAVNGEMVERMHLERAQRYLNP
ncbi:HpcH/HpaI aldolase/citrate lyase family protein [Asticcacaulis tiandongensis]|uniref:HpcH/HpaI aldolase/citrate lyase family protein n=1 Tax=Asticcacaulis tiandongensis TaxID=2565365 RepID=UPI001126E2A7|nr:CoA ester lyase [Asticcacaulis tiandongensis]